MELKKLPIIGREFSKIDECKKYCQEEGLQCFQKDINERFSKRGVADSYENIYNNIKRGSYYYYESWLTNQQMKLYIDYDKKSNDMSLTEHKHDIFNVILKIKNMFNNIKNEDIYILKSIPDDEKKSYHIIFNKIHFNNYKDIKTFVTNNLNDIGYIDKSVYSPKCFRSLLCSKYGQNRRLYIIDTTRFLESLEEKIYTIEETTLEHFKRSCITYIEDTSTLINISELSDTHLKKKTGKQLKILENDDNDDDDIYTSKQIIKKYLDILDSKYYTEYDKWIKIGFVLHSINENNKDLWSYFSKKWENYDERETSLKWNSFETNTYNHTIYTLIDIIRNENYNEFEQLIKEIPEHDIKYLTNHDNILSRYIYRIYGNSFICSNPEKKEWYFFNGQKWKMDNKNNKLRKLIITEVYQKISNYIKYLEENGIERSIISKYNSILSKIGSGKELCCLEIEFYNDNFNQIIDQNKDLIGFENGVFELTTGEFRKGKPSDYITLSVGYDYNYVTENDEIYIELIDLINKILPYKNVRDFTLKALSSCLDGYIRDENFYIFSGKYNSGGNGKSTIMDLMLKVLGQYAITTPVTLLTTKRESANNANSALASIVNKRLIVMQEPESTDSIQAGTMKALTGGDRISTRDLNTKQIEFIPSGKMFMCCNALPSINGNDGGTIRRLKITEFVSKFVDDPIQSTTDSSIYEFKIDRNLKSKLSKSKYYIVFMNILIKYYNIYIKEGLIPPTEVIKATKKYEEENNNIRQFVIDNITKTSKKDFIDKKDLKELYDNDSILKNTFKKFNNFISQLQQNLAADFVIDKTISKLYGYKIKSLNVDEDDLIDQ
jgi:P4 family phage/plasmid primase-like protien